MLRMEAFQIEFAVVRASAISMVAMEEFDYSDLGCDDDDEAVPAPKKKIGEFERDSADDGDGPQVSAEEAMEVEVTVTEAEQDMPVQQQQQEQHSCSKFASNSNVAFGGNLAGAVPAPDPPGTALAPDPPGPARPPP